MIKAEKGVGFKLRLRIGTVTAFLLISGLIIIARLVTVQLVQHASLQAKAKKQYSGIILLQPKRGIIYDRNSHPIAISIPTESLYANTQVVKNLDQAAQSMAPILDMKVNTLATKLKSEKTFMWIKRQLSPKETERLKMQIYPKEMEKQKGPSLPGFGFITESKRFYPKRGFASQLVGFVGIDNQGLEGLEFYYDKFIKGEPEKVIVERDAIGRFLFTPGESQRKETQGNALILTIDESIQYYAEKELREQVMKTGAKGGIAVVMDPFSGQILALADQPQFNPNSFGQYDPKEWKNGTIADSFEPGSTFKIVTAAAVLEQGKAKPDDMFFAENGAMHVHGHTISDVHKYGWLSFRDIIVNSSNIGATKLASLLSPQDFYRYITSFGFGRETGIDLPGENPGLMRPPKEWSSLSQYSLAFGQEISVTAMQMAAAVSVIANGGILYKPQVVKEIRKGNNEEIIQRFSPVQVRRVISAETAKTVTSFLTEVVSRGTGAKASIEGIKVAGKTGTAQKIDPKTGTYSGQKYTASFVGFLPADNPKLTIVVIIDEPKGVIYGGEVSAPAFKKIGQHSLRVLQQLTPQKVIKTEKAKYQKTEEILAANWPDKDFKGEDLEDGIEKTLRTKYKNLLAHFLPIRERILSLWRGNNANASPS